MEKEALLTIILQDIKELETLVSTFKGKQIIPDVFIQLSKSKTQGILDEIQLLASIKDIQEPTKQSEVTEKPTPTSPPEALATTEELIKNPAVTEPKKEVEQREVVEKEVVEKTEKKTADMPQASPKNGNNTTVLGELLGKNKPSFNERLAERQEPATSKSQPPISDLRRAIGINDRFFFQRELFGGHTDLFNQTIDQLNGLNNMDAALSFISTNFNWDPNNEAVTSFMALLRRRFFQQ